MVKLPECPDSGLGNVDRGFFVIGNKINQMPIFNSFNRADFKSFQEGFEFVQPGGQRLDGTD